MCPFSVAGCGAEEVLLVLTWSLVVWSVITASGALSGAAAVGWGGRKDVEQEKV